MAARGGSPATRAAGFTLIEAVIALGILSLVILTFLGSRTDVIVDASEARSWRVARNIAEEVLSDLQAGARESPPTGRRVPKEEFPGFSYQILIGEAAIGEAESANVGYDDDDAGVEGGSRSERLAWQRERDDQRIARQKGLSLEEYRDQQLQEETDLTDEDEVPSEDTLEDVMVVVSFPNVRDAKGAQQESTFRLRAKVSTLAIQGLTQQEADDLARARGVEPTAADGSAGTTEGAK